MRALGVALQVMSKPSSWFASLYWRQGCDLVSNHFFEFVFFTGEIMTFALLPRFVFWTIANVSSRAWRFVVYLCLVGGCILMAYGLNELTKAVQ